MFRKKQILPILLAFLAIPLWLGAGPSFQELVETADKAEAQGYIHLAIHYNSHALKASPGNLEIQRKLARLLQKAGHNGLAEEQWRVILLSNPTDTEASDATAFLNSKAALESVVAEAVSPPAKADIPWTKGNAVWIVGDARTWVTPLNDYNENTPRNQRIKYIFPQAGTLGFNGGNVSFSWTLDRAIILADNLSGDIAVYPVIEGISAGSASVRPKEWDRIGKEIADKLNAEDRVAGVLFQIAPQEPQLHGLYAAVKKYTQKPVGASFRVWEPSTFKYLDFAVLWTFRTPSKGSYFASVRDLTSSFLRDARDHQTKGFIGVAAIATDQAFESFAYKPNGLRLLNRDYPDVDFGKEIRLRNKVLMKDYVTVVQTAISKALMDDDPSYLGQAIWALHPQGGVHFEDGPGFWYFPSLIDPALWNYFRAPIGAERK